MAVQVGSVHMHTSIENLRIMQWQLLLLRQLLLPLQTTSQSRHRVTEAERHKCSNNNNDNKQLASVLEMCETTQQCCFNLWQAILDDSHVQHRIKIGSLHSDMLCARAALREVHVKPPTAPPA